MFSSMKKLCLVLLFLCVGLSSSWVVGMSCSMVGRYGWFMSVLASALRARTVVNCC